MFSEISEWQPPIVFTLQSASVHTHRYSLVGNMVTENMLRIQ
jgi:hypothetical protein